MASKPEEKRPVGRPRYTPDEIDQAKVDALCSTNAPHKLIAWYMQKDIKTLKKHFPEEFAQTTRENQNEMVEYGLFYKAAFKLDTMAMIFWLKHNMKEKYGDKPETTEDLNKNEFLQEIASALNANKAAN